MILFADILKKYPVVAAQSTRLGGFSSGPYNSLNLGISTPDDREMVMKNRELFFGSLGIKTEQLAFTRQIHSANIIHVEAPGGYNESDALITNKKNIFLTVTAADCTPVLIYDKKNNACAAIHAGWRGTASKIVALTLEKMQTTFQTQGKDCIAFIGACISDKHFEVGEEVAKHFDEAHKYFNPEINKFFVDLKRANQSQLIQFGVPESQIEVSEFCTVEHNERFFSWRKEKALTGRMMAVIGMPEV